MTWESSFCIIYHYIYICIPIILLYINLNICKFYSILQSPIRTSQARTHNDIAVRHAGHQRRSSRARNGDQKHRAAAVFVRSPAWDWSGDNFHGPPVGNEEKHLKSVIMFWIKDILVPRIVYPCISLDDCI